MRASLAGCLLACFIGVHSCFAGKGERRGRTKAYEMISGMVS